MVSATPLPDGWTEGTVEANGITIHYTRTGEGENPPLVIAHGAFDDGPCRTPLAEELAADYDVFLIDARGHGRSDAPDSGYDAETRVADFVGAIDALGIENPILFGHSMGGDTVSAAAAEYPDLPRAVVLEDPGPLLHPPDDEDEGEDDPDEADAASRAEEIRGRIEWWHDRSKEELLEEDDELRGHVEAGRERLARYIADSRLRLDPNMANFFEHGLLDAEDVFPDIEAPTLVLRADVADPVVARDEELVSTMADGRVVHVEGAGHCVFRDRREAANEELWSFLDSL